MSRRQTDAEDLLALRRRLDAWRRRHGGRGRRIPEYLWRAAARAAQTEDPAEVARVLRLRRERLEAKAACEAASSFAPELDEAEFVEVQLPATESARPGAQTVVVQIEAPDGRRLRLELPSARACDVSALLAAFLEDGR